MADKIVGVLGLQGDFAKHSESLKRLHVASKIVRWPEDLRECDALILPGGESTTFINLMHKTGLFEAIGEFGRNHPVFGTCAGLIVLGKAVTDGTVQTLGLIDIDAERNAYGRQVDSFADMIDIHPVDVLNPKIEAIFIRAPKIARCGTGVISLGIHGNDTVLARNEHILVASFHPELIRDVRIHRYFLEEF